MAELYVTNSTLDTHDQLLTAYCCMRLANTTHCTPAYNTLASQGASVCKVADQGPYGGASA